MADRASAARPNMKPTLETPGNHAASSVISSSSFFFAALLRYQYPVRPNEERVCKALDRIMKNVSETDTEMTLELPKSKMSEKPSLPNSRFHQKLH